MPGSKYRLTYFPVKGRGELIRLIFHAARVPFEDRRIPFAEWPQFKPKTPTGKLPILEINGDVFVESGAITNWAARKFGLMGKTDADELKTLTFMIQATDLRENYWVPVLLEKDPEKLEIQKKNLEEELNKMFTMWEANVLQTESTGGKIFSYMVTQCMTAADLALLYIADLAKECITVDWERFPRLQAVIKTISDLPHLKAYLTNRDNPEMASSSQTTPRRQPLTPRAQATQKQFNTSSKSMETPRSKGNPGQSVKQKA